MQDDEKILKVKRLSEHAKIPVRSSDKAAGLDLFAAENKIVEAHSRNVISTDLAILLPEGSYGRIAPRSGLALRNFIDIGAGVIDRDYTGNIKVILLNHSNTNFIVSRGDRIAQLIIEKILTPRVVETDEIEDTDRGNKGFGSTGK